MYADTPTTDRSSHSVPIHKNVDVHVMNLTFLEEIRCRSLSTLILALSCSCPFSRTDALYNYN